jgi:flagellar hook-length control protein FliK
MSVAIALLTKASAHKTGAQSPLAPDAALAGTDFASLLLGQLAASTDLQKDSHLLPSQDSERLTASDEPTKDAASPEDASMLLATLGLATSEQARQIEMMQTSSVSVTQELGMAPAAMTGSALNLMPSTNTAASSSRSSLPDSATNGGKAAIIAGTDVARTKTEAQLPQAIGNDAKIPVALANDITATHTQTVDPALLRLATNASGGATGNTIGSSSGSARPPTFGQTTLVESLVPKVAITDITAANTTALGKTAPTEPALPKVAITEIGAANTAALGKTTPAEPALPKVAITEIGAANTAALGKTAPTEPALPKVAVTDVTAANTTDLSKTAPTEPALPKVAITEIGAANTAALGNTILTEPAAPAISAVNTILTEPAAPAISAVNTTFLGKTGAVEPVPPKAVIAEVRTFLGKIAPAESMPPLISLTESTPTEITVSDLPVTEIPTSNGQGVVANPAHGLGGSSSQSRLEVATPLRDPAWANDFSQKIVWLASNDKQSAQITLNPPDMGPIEISLNLSKDGANAFFVSTNAEVRETIEAALPRLKEMLADVGIQLGQSNVGSESSRQQMENQEARQGSPRLRADNAILGADLPGTLPGQAVTAQGINGLVNTFA